jgi:hypothetical protein
VPFVALVLFQAGLSLDEVNMTSLGKVFEGFLVGGFNHLEKYEFVNGKDYPIYYGQQKHV